MVCVCVCVCDVYWNMLSLRILEEVGKVYHHSLTRLIFCTNSGELINFGEWQWSKMSILFYYYLSGWLLLCNYEKLSVRINLTFLEATDSTCNSGEETMFFFRLYPPSYFANELISSAHANSLSHPMILQKMGCRAGTTNFMCHIWIGYIHFIFFIGYIISGSPASSHT